MKNYTQRTTVPVVLDINISQTNVGPVYTKTQIFLSSNEISGQNYFNIYNRSENTAFSSSLLLIE